MKPRRPATGAPTNGPRPHHNRTKSGRVVSAKLPPAPHAAQPQAQPAPSVGMSPALRYAANLKVLRRHDPSIVSIFDQFSHVCVYHHTGDKWEKKGFEGSFFVFERRAYPPYGFFILNRMGMDDYVQYIYPEDDLDIRGAFLLYRSVPDFSAERLRMAAPLGILDPYIPEDHPPGHPAPPMATYTDIGSRPPSLQDPLTNWTYLLNKGHEKGRSETIGLWMHETGGRDVKEVMKRLHTYVRNGERYPDEFRNTPALDSTVSAPTNGQQTNGVATSTKTNKASTKHSLPGSNGRSANGQSTTNDAGSQLDILFSKLLPAAPSAVAAGADGKVTLDTLFASASNAGTPAPTTSTSNIVRTASAASASKGIALLNSIFASASPDVTSSHPPQSSRTPFPDPPSAPPSTRPHHTEAHPHPPVDEREPPEYYEIHSPKPAVAALPQILTQDVISSLLGLPLPAQPSPASRPSSAAHSSGSSRRRYEGDIDSLGSASPPHILGDATPRPPTRGIADEQLVEAQRPLVPFHEDSSLWPYPRAPLDDRDDAAGVGVVELDFEDTAALSDMAAFAARQASKQQKNKGRKNRREREREGKAEREAIERSWDVPAPTPPPAVQTNGHEQAKIDINLLFRGPENSSAIPKEDASVREAQRPRDAVRATLVANVVAQTHGRPLMERTAFVREVLTLIHTDKAFVDTLYGAYVDAAERSTDAAGSAI